MKFAWTEESIALLRELVIDRKEYSTIAAILQERFGWPVTRGQIAAKVLRLKVSPGPYRPPKAIAAPGTTYGARELPTEPAPEGFRYVFQGPAGQRGMMGLVPVERPVRISGGVTLLELKDHNCRWPLWKDDERPVEPRFCGEIIDATQTYCPEHRKIAYAPDRKKVVLSEEARLARRIAQLRRHERARKERDFSYGAR